MTTIDTWTDTGQLAAAIRRRDVAAVEVMQVLLSWIAERNPALNAIVTLDGDHALEQARAADAALAQGNDCGALHGVPVTLKDCHATAGMRTTAGHPSLANDVPDQDGTIARRLKAAGAIIVGKTNVSPLLADVQSNNEVFGRTNNPWNLARTPGGSSGGAAAAVAAGLVPLDVGSDIGGSIRIPAHCCGIYGLKPTEHRVSNHGHLPDLPQHPRSTRVMNCIGPMARSIDDLILVFGIIAGPDGHDLDVPPVPIVPVDRVELSSVRVAWASSFPGIPTAVDVREAVERLAGELASHGGRVSEALPAIDFEEQLAVRADLRRFVRMFIEEPEQPLHAADYFRTLDRRDAFIRAWEGFFDTWDVLICPALMVTAFPHCDYGDPVMVDGEPQEYRLLPDYCRPFNLTGHPVVTIPVGLDCEGLPIGVQIVGRRWGDEHLLGIAREIAAYTPGFQRPPGY